MASITKDTIIGEILDMDQTTAPFFLEMGMHCLGCPSSRGETVEQACMVHGVDADELVQKAQRAFGEQVRIAKATAARHLLPGGSIFSRGWS